MPMTPTRSSSLKQQQMRATARLALFSRSFQMNKAYCCRQVNSSVSRLFSGCSPFTAWVKYMRMTCADSADVK